MRCLQNASSVKPSTTICAVWRAERGLGLAGWLRISLTQPDEKIAEAAERIGRHALGLKGKAA